MSRCVTKIWQMFVQFMANFWQKILTMAILLAIMIFRYFMFFAIYIFHAFQFLKFDNSKKICLDGNQDAFSVNTIYPPFRSYSLILDSCYTVNHSTSN